MKLFITILSLFCMTGDAGLLRCSLYSGQVLIFFYEGLGSTD